MSYSNENDLYDIISGAMENVYFREELISKITDAVWNDGYRKLTTTRIKNNPIDILLAVFEKHFPKTAERIKTIEFATIEDDAFGVTQFNNDGSIEIYISPTIKDDAPITFEVATELLAHELAHAIAGKDEKHGVIWEAQFDKLNELYVATAKEIAGH